MKKQYMFVKLFGVGILVILTIAYMLFYFLPSLENINRKKRQLKDMNHKIDNYLKTENTFVFPNEREEKYLEAADTALTHRMPNIEDKEDFIVLFTGVFDYLKTLARKDGISNMMVTSDSNELEINAGSLSKDKKSFRKLLNFSTMRMNEMQQEEENKKRRSTSSDMGVSGRAGPAKSVLVEGMNSHTVFLSFSGNIKNAVSFINHIPWGNFYLKPRKIVVSGGDLEPYFMMDLEIYYIDRRTNAKQ